MLSYIFSVFQVNWTPPVHKFWELGGEPGGQLGFIDVSIQLFFFFLKLTLILLYIIHSRVDIFFKHTPLFPSWKILYKQNKNFSNLLHGSTLSFDLSYNVVLKDIFCLQTLSIKYSCMMYIDITKNMISFRAHFEIA